MPDNSASGDITQVGVTGEATTPSTTAGSGAPDPVKLLESRLAGLEARLTENGRARTQAEKDRDDALARLSAYETGKLTENEAFQAELKRERERADEAVRAARLAKVEARYPETFGVLGEAAHNLSDEQLAAAEARFLGKAPEEGAPTPRTPAAQRPSTTSTAAADRREGESLDQLRARFRAMDFTDIID
jgi:hypothetical protein